MSARKSITKKGLAKSFILYIIIGLIIAVTIIMLMSKWKASTDYLVQKEECKKSVYQHAISNIAGIPTELKCQTNYFTLAYDPETEKGQEMIKKQIADLWLDSCDVFGRGELNLFSGENTFCAIYAVIDFEKQGIEFSGMSDFLIDKKVPGTNKKYIEACHALDQTIDYEKLREESAIDPIDTSKKYAVVFVYTKEESMIKQIITGLGGRLKAAGTGVLGGAAVGIVVFAATPIGWAGATFLGIGTAAVATYTALTGGSPPVWLASFLIKEYDSEVLDELGCKEFPVVQQYRPK